MKRYLALSVAAVLVWATAAAGLWINPVFANSCAVDVSSTPAGASVYVNGVFVGETPIFYTIGFPTTANVTVTLDGYQRWSEMVVVPLNARVPVDAVLIPLADGAMTVTTTVTTTVTSTLTPATVTTTETITSATTRTVTTTSATTITSTLAPRTITSTTTAAAQTVTTTREITETIGLPAEVTYAAVGIAIIAIIAAAMLTMRKR